MDRVGVLTARVRVEEKQLLEALAIAGLAGTPLPPASEPLPLTPSPAGPSATVADGLFPALLIDRCRDRAMAAAVLPVWQALGVKVLGAGLAATGNRLMAAIALAAAGLPRPATQLVCGEAAALRALGQTGYPATLLPLTADGVPILLLDEDSAEAILEHRGVLGGAPEAIGLLQAGSGTTGEHVTVLVVGGKAVAFSQTPGGDCVSRQMLTLAETAAAVLQADLVGIELAMTVDGPVVWDVQPVPDFRGWLPVGEKPVAVAIAELAGRRLGREPSWMHDVAIQMTLAQVSEREVHSPREVAGGVALSA